MPNKRKGAKTAKSSAADSMGGAGDKGIPPGSHDWQNRTRSVVDANRYALDNKVETDVDFIVGENKERISAHKLILSFRSPVFHSMFFGNLAKGEKEIILPDVEPVGFHKLLR